MTTIIPTAFLASGPDSVCIIVEKAPLPSKLSGTEVEMPRNSLENESILEEVCCSFLYIMGILIMVTLTVVVVGLMLWLFGFMPYFILYGISIHNLELVWMPVICGIFMFIVCAPACIICCK